MLGDCVITGEKFEPSKMSENSTSDLKSPASATLTSPPPTKKLKQARLSFKLLEPKPVIETKPTTPTSGKKRKLSEGTPKSAKIQKNEGGGRIKRAPPQDDAENEVSSSSEADFNSKVSSLSKPRGLDRFVQSTQQLEVSTSCEDVVDLTAEDQTDDEKSRDQDQKEEKKLTDQPKTCTEDSSNKENPPEAEPETQPKDEPETKEDDGNKTTQEESMADSVSEPDIKDNTEEESKNIENESAEADPKEDESKVDNCDTSTLDSTMDGSDISQSQNESTEVSDEEKESEEGSDRGSTSGPSTPVTPASRTLKRPPLSSTKSKQKEEERQRRKDEKEKARLEKLKQKDLEKQKKEELRKEKEKQREQQRLEKEKQKKEEKERKEQERLQREKEKQEKLAEKEREKEEKNRQKEEEKKKKQEAIEAKLEEKKRKEEEKEAERKKKEEEKLKEEADKNRKIQQTQSMFKKFFKKVEPTEAVKTTEKVGPFAAFQVLPNMRMAPRVRVQFEVEQTDQLDQHLQQQSASDLYLAELKAGTRTPGLSEQTWPVDDDLQVLENSPEEKPQQKLKPKLFQFHENYRPAYFGTWRKRSKTVSPRNPFKKDEVYLDYDVDSDDEWEEEEPGESLSHSEGEGEDGDEDNADDDDDGFFVPHGYLSDGEGAEDEDEDGNPEKMKMRQIIKAKAFEAELKKRTEVLQKLMVGCLWCQAGQESDSMLSQFSANLLVDDTPIMIEKATETSTREKKKNSEKASAKESKGMKLQPVPDEAMSHLIRLVHGNISSLKKLIREFRVFWSRLQKGETGDESKSAVTSMDTSEDKVEKTVTPTAEQKGIADSSEKKSPTKTGEENTKEEDMDIEEQNGAHVISRRQLDIKLRSIAVYEKRKCFHKKCWYVNQDVLEKYGLVDLPVPTEWNWITPGPAKPKEVDPSGTPASKKPLKEPQAQATPNNHSIKQFAVPGLIHANTPEVLEATKPKVASPSPANAGKKTGKRITPITLFCAKKPSAENSLKPKSLNTNNDSQDPPLSKSATTKPVIVESTVDDDDCMIVDEPFVPPPPSKSQPTLLTMFPVKNT